MTNPRIVPRTFLIASGIAFALAFYSATVLLQANFRGALPFSIGTGVMLVFCVVLYTEVTLRALRLTRAEVVVEEAVVPAETLADIEEFVPADGESRLSSDQVVFYAGCVVAGARYFARISEHVESFHRSTLVRSTYTVRWHPAPDLTAASNAATAEGSLSAALQGYILPLHLPEKGTLTDGLRVFDGSGKRVSTVHSREQIAFAGACFRVLTRMASPRARDAYLEHGRRVEKVILGLLHATAPSKTEIESAMLLLERLDSSDEAQGYLVAAADLLQELASRSPISVAVSQSTIEENPWPSTLRFTLERRMVTFVEKAPVPALAQRAVAIMDSIRLALAVRLNRVYFPVDAASQTESYHLEVEGPTGTYFARGELLETDPEPGEYRIRVQDLRGQRRAHLYMGGAVAKEGRYYGAQFFERAPGSFATVVVAGIVSSVLIVMLGWMNLTISNPAEDRTSSIIPALLALPIAIATFIGLEGSRGRRHPSLLSRFIALSIAFLSLAVLILALVKHDIDPRVWWTVMAASVSTTLIAILSWGIRLSTENSFVRGHQ